MDLLTHNTSLDSAKPRGSGKDLLETRFTTLSLVESKSKEGKVVLRGEFGWADRATENKRRYPSKLLLREFKRLNEAMAHRRMYGELDHPCLLSDDFRVLTAEGWKPFRAVQVGDRVWSRKDGRAVLSTVQGITDQPYDGPAFRVAGRSIDSGFTPAHRFLTVKRPDNGRNDEQYATLAEIAADPGRFAHSAIPKTAVWPTEAPSTVSLPGVLDAGRCRNDVTQPLVLDAALFAAFMGLYLSEGSCVSDDARGYNVFISQKTPWSRKFIWDEVLRKFPADLQWSEEPSGFRLSDARLYRYVKSLGDAYSKYVPSEIKRLSAVCLKEFLFWYGIGDGRMVGVGPAATPGSDRTVKEQRAAEFREGAVPFTRRDLFTVSERLVRDLHECVVRSGGAGSLLRIDPDTDYEFAGRLIAAADKVPLYQLHIAQSENIWLDPRFLKVEPVHHTGNIYCLTVTHGNFYMEQNGKSFWTGNSDARTSLHRVSHIITNLELTPGGIVVGEMEILPTPAGKVFEALVRAGCRVGVSSRGFGSTKLTEDGIEEVQEDYQLVTYDAVADPAANSAYPKVYYEWIQRKEHAIMDGQDKKIAEAVSAVTEQLKGEFATKLEKLLPQLKAEALETARSELMTDPSVAGAKVALDQIKAVAAPFLLGEDAQRVVAQKDAEIATLRQELKAKDTELKTAKEESATLAGVAKEAGYKYFMERVLAGNQDADLIRRAMGDVKQYATADALKKKMEAVQTVIQRRRAQDEAARAAEGEKRGELEKQIEQLRAQNSLLKEGLGKAVGLAKKQALTAYAERRVTGSRREQARSVVENSRASTQTEVDRLLEAIPADTNPERNESTRARVRRLTGAGVEASALDEETPTAAPSSGRQDAGGGYNGLDAELVEIRELAGLN